MSNRPAPYGFKISAQTFLERAQANLDKFETDSSVDHFFYAALELRFGIEARLHEYLKPALKSIGRDKKIVEFVATKLLKQLQAVDSDALRESTLALRNEAKGKITTLQFTPVTSRLAEIHGRLGELLHYTFFTRNESWAERRLLGGKPRRSIADFAELLKEGVKELAQATSGSLLSHARFTQLVQEVVADCADD